MNTNRRFAIVTMMLLFGARSLIGQEAHVALEDTPENRAKAASDYLKVASIEDLLNDVTEKVALQLPAPNRELFKSLMTKHIDKAALREATQRALTKYFTVDELQAMTSFYSTPQGKSILKKMGLYTAEVMPVIQSQVATGLQAALQDMKAEGSNQ